VLIACVLAWAACTDTRTLTSPPTTASLQDEGGLSSAIKTQASITNDLLKRPGIVGTGIRIGPNGHLALAVYAVSAKAAAAATLPSQVDSLPVIVVVTGRFYALNVFDPKTKERPAPMGFSVGHPGGLTGSIGARVVSAGHFYLLSCNHILALENNASVGDAELQPGPADGGVSTDSIASLTDFQTIAFDGSTNTIDAAIAEVADTSVLAATPWYAYGAPSGNTVTAALSQSVQKFGRTTALTTGTVSEINVTVDVCYSGDDPCTQLARFSNQFAVTPGTFSRPGDSGSLIVTNNSNRDAVGLLFAGSDTRTLANPIATVLQRFGVGIVGLSVHISGTAWIRFTGNYTWTTTVTGGTPPYTYTWFYSEDSTSWFGVGSASSYTRHVTASSQQNDPSFWLEAKVVDARGATTTQQLFVKVGNF
jgi:hypothetical protein